MPYWNDMFETIAASERTAKAGQIQHWRREGVSLPERAVVMVTELRCTESSCPPLETGGAVMLEATAGDARLLDPSHRSRSRAFSAPRRRLEVHEPLAALDEENVESAAPTILRDETSEPTDAAPCATR